MREVREVIGLIDPTANQQRSLSILFRVAFLLPIFKCVAFAPLMYILIMSRKSKKKNPPHNPSRPQEAPGRPFVWCTDELAQSLFAFVDEAMEREEVPILELWMHKQRNPDSGKPIGKYLYELADRSKVIGKPDLADALEIFRDGAKGMIQRGGYRGTIPPGFAKMAMMQHGWSERINEVTAQVTIDQEKISAIADRLGGIDKIGDILSEVIK